MCETLRSPITILENLQKHSKEENYKYERLYRNLYNEDFYLQALQNIGTNLGAMMPGGGSLTLNKHGKEKVERVVCSVKNHSYQPKPIRGTSVKSKYVKTFGIPSVEDRMVEEVIKMILEHIYDPTFLQSSHGFRPARSCHTALIQIQQNFTDVKWFVEGKIKSCYDTIDHHNLVNILRRRIKDEAFIELIWKFLNAGYLENWEYNITYSGISQGSGLSPILINIYLNEFDRFMDDYKRWFDRGTEREFRETPEGRNYKRLLYVRYADSFFIGVTGSKANAEKIKSDIGKYLRKSLKLELSAEETLIKNSNDKARFLGYDITTFDDNVTQRVKSNGILKTHTGKIKLLLPKEKWVENLLSHNMLRIVTRADGKEVWKPLQKNDYIFLPVNEMVRKYNAQIQGIYNYYCLASNVSVLSKFHYVTRYSLYKTVAAKYRITMVRAKRRYTKDKMFRVPYMTRNGMKYAVFYNDGFRKGKKVLEGHVDILPEYKQFDKSRELFLGYTTDICEMNGTYVPLVKVKNKLVECGECGEVIHHN